MKTLTTRITPVIVSLFLFACAPVQEEAVEPTEPATDTSILLELVNISWLVDNCPPSANLNIDGYSECEYMKSMNFTEESVFMKHGNDTYFTRHNICQANGANLVISRQGCGFTEWNGVIEMKIINYSENELEVEVQLPNLSENYAERYTYRNS